MPAREVKVCLVGLHNAGKTALFNRFVYGEFIRTEMTIGAYFGPTLNTENNIQFNIWDTAGQEKFYHLTDFYLRETDIIILVADPTASNFEEQLDYLSARLQVQPKGVVLVATKKDLVTPENQAAVNANIQAFYEKFSKETDPKPLFVSAKEDQKEDQNADTKSLLTNRILQFYLLNKNNAADQAQNADVLGLEILISLQTIEYKLKNRFLKPDPSRLVRLQHLKAKLEQCETLDEIKTALLDEARFLRTPDENGRHRYGINLGSTRFKFFVHFRGYEHSEFYQFIKKQLFTIDPSLDLAKESDPKFALAAYAAAASGNACRSSDG
jgi:small GTP-binding protein